MAIYKQRIHIYYIIIKNYPSLRNGSAFRKASPGTTRIPFTLCLSRAFMGLLAHLKDIVGTLTTEVVLAGQDDHWFGEHLQTDGADKLLLQAIHAL